MKDKVLKCPNCEHRLNEDRSLKVCPDCGIDLTYPLLNLDG